MPGSHAMEIPATPRGAALVSVDGRTYPLESARVTAEATGGIALSTLSQTYRNPYAESLEVLYTLPLPADGAVVGYTMRLGERVIRGEVKKREEARAEFEKALFEGRSAALLEQDRDDTFTQRLGALPAGQSAEIAIEILHPLAFLVAAGEEGAQWEYRFPTVVGVRYQGAEGRVPDAHRLDVDRGDSGAIPARIELTLTAAGAAGHTVRRVEAMPLDRDLVVRFPAATAAIGAELVEGPGLPGDGGRYGVLAVTPPQVPPVEFARDLTILIDASGSMSGEPIEWAKDVSSGLLRSLGTGDRFEVIAFASEPRPLTLRLLPANAENLGDVLGKLANLRAGGATEMAAAVYESLRPLRAGAQHQVVLVTDGEIGFEDEVVARIVAMLPDGARLHTVGVGAAPNRTLTASAARAGRGVESFVCGDAEVQAAVKRLVAATARPVLTDVAIAGSAVKGVAPARPRDVLAGQPIAVALELDPNGGVVEVTGRLAGAATPWTWRVDVPPIAARSIGVANVPIGAMYGRETIADLELNENQSDSRITDVALRHRIASRMTSLVAISDDPTVDPRNPRRRQILPVEVPAFQSAEALGLRSVAYRAKAKMQVFDQLSLSRHATALPDQGDAFKMRVMERRFGALGGPEPIDGRVVSVQGDLLFIEYASPEDGFEGPDESTTVETLSSDGAGAVLVVAASSPKGPHARGVLLRVVVCRLAGAWHLGDSVVLELGRRDRTIRATIPLPGK